MAASLFLPYTEPEICHNHWWLTRLNQEEGENPGVLVIKKEYKLLVVNSSKSSPSFDSIRFLFQVDNKVLISFFVFCFH